MRTKGTLCNGAESGGDDLLSRLEWVTEEDLNIVLDYEEVREPGVDGILPAAGLSFAPASRQPAKQA